MVSSIQWDARKQKFIQPASLHLWKETDVKKKMKKKKEKEEEKRRRKKKMEEEEEEGEGEGEGEEEEEEEKKKRKNSVLHCPYSLPASGPPLHGGLEQTRTET